MRFIAVVITSPWWRHKNGNIFRITGPLCGEFTGPGEFPAQRPVTRSFDVFFDLRLNKRLNKQSWGWWFETLSRPFWRHRNAIVKKINRVSGFKNYKASQCVLRASIGYRYVAIRNMANLYSQDCCRWRQLDPKPLIQATKMFLVIDTPLKMTLPRPVTLIAVVFLEIATIRLRLVQ